MESEDFKIPEIMLEFKGTGRYAPFGEAIWKSNNGSKKIVWARPLTETELMDAKKRNQMYLRVKHVNILDYFGVFFNGDRHFILMERADCGSLINYISDGGRNATTSVKINWMRQLANAIIYLHSQNLVLGGISLYEMFLTDNYKTLKIASSYFEYLGTEKDISDDYSEHERRKIDAKKKHQLKQEVRCFGFILQGVMDNSPIESDAKDINFDYLKSLMKSCLNDIEEKRPTMEEVEFILGIDRKVKVEYKRSIGHGSFGVVHEAIWRTGDGIRKTVAAKILNDCENGFGEILREISILSELQHKNIVSFLKITLYNGKPVILMEYADCGSVYDYIHDKDKQKVSDNIQFKWMQHFTNGLAYLHDKNILHRDLKTKNLVLTNQFTKLMICDFGLVKYLETTNTSRSGTYGYMAPEVAIGGKYTTKCDVFSFGVVLWEIMAKKKPLYDIETEGNLDVALQFKIQNGGRPNLDDAKDYSYFEYIKNIMEQCWAQEPANRPTMKDVQPYLCNDSAFDVEYEKKIGQGCFSDVYEAIWVTEDGARNKVAAKKPKRIDGFEGIQREIRILSRLKHANILSFYDITMEVDRPVILMEYANQGSVYHFLHNPRHRKENLDMIKLNWIVQCANGLAYLHEQNILHYDLKTKNLMLTEQINILKICDFGLGENIGTIHGYMAPEIFQGHKYTTKCDIFSFGIVVWEIMSEKKPLYDIELKGDHIAMQYKNHQGCRPDIDDAKDYSHFEYIKTIMEQCWEQEAAKRPAMKDVIHYIRDLHLMIDVEHIERISALSYLTIDKVVMVFTDGTRNLALRKTLKLFDWHIFQKDFKRNSFRCQLKSEIPSLFHLKHTNIVSLLDISISNDSVLYLEYADCGSLHDYIHFKSPSEQRVIDVPRLNWMIQCARGLAYLHEQNVLHRNLTTQKMLLTDNFRTLKIYDYSRLKNITSPWPIRNYFVPKDSAQKGYTTKCDVFSFGWAFWEVMSNEKPIKKFKRYLKTGKCPNLNDLMYFENIDHIKSIITKCWAEDETDRPTMEEVVLGLGVENQLTDEDIFTRTRTEKILNLFKCM